MTSVDRPSPSGPAGMTPEEWARVSEIVDRAFDLPADARGQFLERACAGNAMLRGRIEALLAADREAGAFLEARTLPPSLVEALAAPDADDVEERGEAMSGRVIGAWRILHELGRGGMASVHLAERADGAFTQHVALKLVKRGLDTDEILRRFLRERRILASLQHPHIARILDGGVTEDGLPWFAMEYVEGEPITAWCESRRAPISQRLLLVRAVCDAVQYAHRNLVVHRDLKPSNIFVTRAGDVKLLDFGIARLLASDDTEAERTLTGPGARVLTIPYAAPEQIRGEPATTATDVYGLGVVLYELLARARPCGRAATNLQEMERAVLEEDPLPPSAVRKEFRRQLAGDLDRITLMALRKEPELRYASAEALRLDIDRYRDGFAVQAAGPSRIYRVRKLVKRHRAMVVAASIVLLTAVIGAAVALWQAVAAALLVAILVGGLAVTLAQTRAARREARKAEQVRQFLVSVFQVSDPSSARGQSITARELLDQGAQRIETELQGEPELKAEILGVLGDLHVKLGLTEAGLRIVQREWELLQALPKHRASRAGALRRRGELLIQSGDWAGAEECFRQAAELHRATRGDVSAEHAEDLDLLTWMVHVRGRRDEAEQIQRRSLAIRRELVGNQHPSVASALNNLAVLARAAGRTQEAEALFRECLGIRRAALPTDHPDALDTLINLTALLRQLGRYLEAEETSREALALHRKVYGDDHPLTAGAYNTVGSVMLSLARWDEAERMFRQALRYWEAHGGRDHPNAVATINNLAATLRDRGDLEAAEPLAREAVDAWRAKMGDRHLFYASGLVNWGALLRLQGRLDEADAALATALDIQRVALGDDHPDLSNAWFQRGLVAQSRKEFEEAEHALRTAASLRDRHLGSASHPAALCRVRLAVVLAECERSGEARRLLDEARDALARALPADHPDRAEAERIAARLT